MHIVRTPGAGSGLGPKLWVWVTPVVHSSNPGFGPGASVHYAQCPYMLPDLRVVPYLCMMLRPAAPSRPWDCLHLLRPICSNPFLGLNAEEPYCAANAVTLQAALWRNKRCACAYMYGFGAGWRG